MDLLRELTLKGKLIFAVIHQPSSEIYKEDVRPGNHNG